MVAKTAVKMEKRVAVIDFIGKKGGNHYYSLMLLKAFEHRGWKTFIYSNFTDTNFPSQFDETYPFELNRDFKGLKALLAGTRKAAKLAVQNKVQYVVFHLFDGGPINYLALRIIRSYGLKVIGIAHDIASFVMQEKSWFRNKIYTQLLDHVIVHNQFSFNALKEAMPPKAVERTTLIRHGGHTDVISPISREEALAAFNLNAEDTHLLFFGQIKKVKGLPHLLEAFAKTKGNLKLIIAGKPWKDDFSEYQETIDRLGIGDRVVKIIRYISDAERNSLYSAADFLALPYLEIFQSGVLLMAMSYGLPVIASDLPANAEVIEQSKNGLLYPVKDVEALAKGITQLADNKALCEQIAAGGKATIAEQYNWNTLVLEYESMLGMTD